MHSCSLLHNPWPGFEVCDFQQKLIIKAGFIIDRNDFCIIIFGECYF